MTHAQIHALLTDTHATLAKIFEHPCSNADGGAGTNIATLAHGCGSRLRAALRTIHPDTDPAAVYGIANSLETFARRDDFKGNVSDAYSGADQFMREIMKMGERFETWANMHVDFDQLDDVWPYMLQDKFADALAKVLGASAILALDKLSDAEFPAIAKALKLTLKK